MTRPHEAVTEERIADWEVSWSADLHDAAAEIRRLQARERQLLEASNRSLELRREAEARLVIRTVQIDAMERWSRELLDAVHARTGSAAVS